MAVAEGGVSEYQSLHCIRTAGQLKPALSLVFSVISSWFISLLKNEEIEAGSIIFESHTFFLLKLSQQKVTADGEGEHL